MRRLKFLFYLSIILLVAGGVLFVKDNRHQSVANIAENLKNKTTVFYSSNFKRVYALHKVDELKDMERLCMEGASILAGAGLNAEYLQIQDGNDDPFTLSGEYLDKNLQKGKEYIVIDVSRGQTRHGKTIKTKLGMCCPISIILSQKSLSFDRSLLLAGRIKAVIHKSYPDLPVQIIQTDDRDYNQSKGYMGMLIEFGDAANLYEEARNSLKIFCNALIKVSGDEY